MERLYGWPLVHPGRAPSVMTGGTVAVNFWELVEFVPPQAVTFTL
jgi:hypothetical protein